jgi:hypothetical protein
MSCGRRADREVNHPYRPEDKTPLCGQHAAVVADELESGEVVANVEG